MSSSTVHTPVVRAFDKKQRVATGRTMRDGTFKQFYPMKLTLNSEAEWRHLWKFRVKRVKFTVDTPVAAPAPAPARVATRSSATVVAPAPAPTVAPVEPSPQIAVRTPNNGGVNKGRFDAPAPSSTQEHWMCPYCGCGPGNDHRLCICRGYNYSVEAWEIACGIRKPAEVPRNPPLTSTPVASAATTPAVPTTATSSAPVVFNKNDWKYTNTRTATFPPGKYYIGDLCYVLSEDIYHKVFGGDNRDYESGLYSGPNNQSFLVGSTAWGDGLYVGSDGKEFGVDAGIIGICPVSLMAKDDGGGHIYDFKDTVRCVFKNGVFRFSQRYEDFVINTYGDDDE